MMANQLKSISLLIVLLAIAVCAAETPRYRQRFIASKLQPLRQRPAVHQKRVLARQEFVTPYPTADELKPEVPFEEGNMPDEVYGPPDQVYGPPEADQVPTEQLPSEEAPEEFAPNPEAEEFQPAEENTLEQKGVSRLTKRRKASPKGIVSRLVQKKKPQKSQRLVTRALPLSSPYTAQPQRYYLSNQPFPYSSQYQTW